jgi:hypothetical protein
VNLLMNLHYENKSVKSGSLSKEKRTKPVACNGCGNVEQIRMCITARDDKVIKAVDLVSFFISFLGLFNYLNTVSRLRVNYHY